jgi:biopolymer transport protein ExbB/TolQ
MSMFVLSSPAAWLLWFIVLAVAMYFARLPAHRAILSLACALHHAMRLATHSLRLAEQKLAARNREVLLAAGREAKERIIEREFERIDASVRRDLSECPALYRRLGTSKNRVFWTDRSRERADGGAVRVGRW